MIRERHGQAATAIPLTLWILLSGCWSQHTSPIPSPVTIPEIPDRASTPPQTQPSPVPSRTPSSVAEQVPQESLPAPLARGDSGIQISTKGSDKTGNGTAAHPYRTIQYVLNEVAKAGETLVLHPGTYTEEVRVRLPRITIRSHSSGRAVISTPVSTDEDNGSPTVLLDVDSDGSRLENLEITGGFYGVKLESKWDWGENDRSGTTHITLDGCLIHDTGRDAVKVTPGSDYLTIRRTEIHHSGAGYPAGTALDDKNAEGIDIVNADHVLIQDTYIHHAATTCLYLKGGSRFGVVERVRAENCGVLGIGVGFDTSPEWFDLTENPNYYENIGGVVRNCLVSNTGYAGIGLYGSLDAMIVNNTIINTAKLGHSPLYFGLTYQDWEPEAKRPPSRNTTLRNNLVSQGKGYTAACVGIRYSSDLGGMAGLQGFPVMDHNLYFQSGDKCRFQDSRPTSSLDKGLLADWRRLSGTDKNSIEASPNLTSDGHINSGSPAIGKGMVTPWVTLDFDGQPRSSRNDIGADQRI